MYMVVNKFLLGHQYLDFKRVPEFFKLFYSSDLEVSQVPKAHMFLFSLSMVLSLVVLPHALISTSVTVGKCILPILVTSVFSC